MAKASITQYVESLEFFAPLVNLYNSHKSSAPRLPADASVKDIVAAINAHVMANFILLPCPNSEDFELTIGMVKSGNCADNSKTIKGIVATMEERTGSKCALVCVDSIAGIYRASYSDPMGKESGVGNMGSR